MEVESHKRQSEKKQALSIKEAAEILDVSVDTIRRAIKSGALQGFQLNKAGDWRISILELERFIRSK